jgi:hypothetical protein
MPGKKQKQVDSIFHQKDQITKRARAEPAGSAYVSAEILMAQARGLAQ